MVDIRPYFAEDKVVGLRINWVELASALRINVAIRNFFLAD
jgi:hypothetical protein